MDRIFEWHQKDIKKFTGPNLCSNSHAKLFDTVRNLREKLRTKEGGTKVRHSTTRSFDADTCYNRPGAKVEMSDIFATTVDWA